MGLELYELLPDYRDRCPVCGGRECPVRHGLYRRTVIEQTGEVYSDFPVPRFLCNRRGEGDGDRTFSVLPAALVRRRRWSLALMLMMVSLVERGMRRALDALASLWPDDRSNESLFLVDELAVQRLVVLFAASYASLCELPLELGLPAGLRGARERAVAVAQALSRAGPERVVMSYHRLRWPELLLG